MPLDTTKIASVQSANTRAPLPWKQLASPFNRTMALTFTILLVVDLILVRTVHLGGTSQLLSVWPAVLILVASLVYCMLRPLPRLVEVCELAIWSILQLGVLVLLILIAGRTHRPLADSVLNSFDEHMHFSTAFFVHLVAHAPVLRVCLAIAYALLIPFAGVAMFLPSLCGHSIASRRFLTAVVLATILTAALFAIWPAAGPWMTQDFAPSRFQAQVLPYLANLKSSGPVELGAESAAIVAFPSFHVALALISAFSLGALRRLRVGAWILAALICISTITTGWHYGVDVLGGIAVAAVSVAVAAWISDASADACCSLPVKS